MRSTFWRTAAFLESLPKWAAAVARAVAAKQANTFVIHGLPAELEAALVSPEHLDETL